MSKSVLVTGSTGFVGTRLMQLLQSSWDIKTCSLRNRPVESLDLSGLDCVLHLAGLAHRMKIEDPEEYFQVNRDMTLSLARSAREQGVKHFVFISTIKVYGLDASEQPIRPDSPRLATDPYGKSKLEAERGLEELENDGFIVTIIRPPLIYGPGSKGNLERLMRLIMSPLPIVLGGISNHRSMLYVDNMIRYLQVIVNKEEGGIFLLHDSPDLSTSDLVMELRNTLKPGKPTFKLPSLCIQLVGFLKPEIHQRVFQSLIIEDDRVDNLRHEIQAATWESGIRTMAVDFLKKK